MRVCLPFLRKQQKGFTLLELLVVIAIIAVLLLVVLARLNLFGRQADLDTTTQRIISTLELARTQTVASEDESVYGVHFETTKYVLFKGATYDPSDIDNKEYNLTTTEISNIALEGGGNDVVFTRIRGTTENSGTVEVSLVADPSRTQTIIINSLGQVSMEETISPADTRRVDTRHLHFGSLSNTCPSLFSYTNLILDFSPYPVVKTIPLNLSPGQTEFSWEGKISVDGSNQTIKIHTHLLDPLAGSVLSVHRDRMKNDKAVAIKIDTNVVVSYDADGNAAKGWFCNVMKVQ